MAVHFFVLYEKNSTGNIKTARIINNTIYQILSVTNWPLNPRNISRKRNPTAKHIKDPNPDDNATSVDKVSGLHRSFLINKH